MKIFNIPAALMACVIMGMSSINAQLFYSQDGQDSFLYETYFKDKYKGVFVEIGAYDGIVLSNSYFFEKELGWTGICIEPNPEAFQRLQKNRNCICIQGCITNFNGTADFLWVHGAKVAQEFPRVEGHLLSGLANKYDARHLGRVNNTVAREQATKEIITTNCYLLEDILREHGITHIDYLSVDTEGGELDILKSINLCNVDIEIIGVEVNFADMRPAIKEYMEENGYVLIQTVGADDIYKKTR